MVDIDTDKNHTKGTAASVPKVPGILGASPEPAPNAKKMSWI
ncbi:hypothetical protein GLIP_3287 [Aliiglaciecola lipolytica E3]|uniref:Uncharacterized protein n=1 Tax=Aliiglaciecola lipolytica E3 TaxID=1127673 RepID=K6XW82_9ALTE|nr:hypothetical protein GLIP_3287 [Aliiglaciecola lipolytica E3]